jgi:hypothetical protein
MVAMFAPALETVKLRVTPASGSAAMKSATPAMPRTFAVTGDASRKRRAAPPAACGAGTLAGPATFTSRTLRPDRSGNVTA